MKNITSEKIDEVLNYAVQNANDNFIKEFCMCFDKFKELFEGEYKFPEDRDLLNQVSADFAIFSTAMCCGMDILKMVLKELLCD